MEGARHKIGNEPKVVDTDLLRFVVSPEYVAFGISGTPTFNTEGPLTGRRIVGEGKVGDDLRPLTALHD